MSCAERDSLRQIADDALQRVIDLTKQQRVALADSDETRPLRLDREMETTFGEKERAFGGLRQHRKNMAADEKPGETQPLPPSAPV